MFFLPTKHMYKNDVGLHLRMHPHPIVLFSQPQESLPFLFFIKKIKESIFIYFFVALTQHAYSHIYIKQYWFIFTFFFFPEIKFKDEMQVGKYFS